MDEAAEHVAPAGWYVDPKTSMHLRWWSGLEWTGHIAPVPDGAHDPIDSSRDSPPTTGSVSTTAPPLRPPVPRIAPVSSYDWEREAGGAADADRIEPALESADEYRIILSRWSTASVWLIAFTPWLTLLTLATALLMYAWGIREWLQYAVAPLPWLFTIACAQRDVKRLRAWGHTTNAHWAWSLLGAPVYLVARTVVLRRHTGIGSPPLWVWLVNLLVSVGTCVLLVTLFAPTMPMPMPGAR
jgi:Protein of unknown function (DUF2510)